MSLIFVRVISGKSRGKKLFSPDSYDVRPTLDRVKESIFNMIAFSVPDATVLDLFAGSGALGIEALSRGAKNAVFVDLSEDSLCVTRKNIAATGFQNSSLCIQNDFRTFLENASSAFDIIFLDPPYADGLLNEALSIIYRKKLLTSGGIIVCESDRAVDFMPDESLFKIIQNKHYGRVSIFLLTDIQGAL